MPPAHTQHTAGSSAIGNVRRDSRGRLQGRTNMFRQHRVRPPTDQCRLQQQEQREFNSRSNASQQQHAKRLLRGRIRGVVEFMHTTNATCIYTRSTSTV
jgi:hypothetical protein